MSAGQVNKVINVRRGSIDDYVIEAIVGFQEGPGLVLLKGRGPYISKAVDVYNELVHRLGDGLELVKVEIGSERVKGRVFSYITISLKKRF
ncbi:DNA-binding protein [Thermogladius sp. KZ2Tp1]|uniref:DNA-binding protein n=1 Tax=unclassified Thermogladius TaxID=2647734 RepID=UPI003D1143A6